MYTNKNTRFGGTVYTRQRMPRNVFTSSWKVHSYVRQRAERGRSSGIILRYSYFASILGQKDSGELGVRD